LRLGDLRRGLDVLALPLDLDEPTVEVGRIFRLLGRHRLCRAHRAALLGDLQGTARHQGDTRGGGGKLCGCQFERHGLTSKMRTFRYPPGQRTCRGADCPALVMVTARQGQRR
jgi:hypothetical protein